MQNFNRQYRFAAGPAGGEGFEVGMTTDTSPEALHISFNIEKADTETPNSAKFSLWNLNPEQLSILNEEDCVVTLRAGYGTRMPLCFVGCVSYVETELDGSDRMTSIEAVDGRIELRDSYVSQSYSGSTNTKKIIEDCAAQMGLAVTFSYNAEFFDLANGYSFVGPAHLSLDKACASSDLQWQIYNGVMQVKRKRDTMTREVYVLSPDTGLLHIPKKITFGKSDGNDEGESGWEVMYFLNGAIGIGDYIRLESKLVKGYFRIRTLAMDGDNLEGDWICTARLIEA